MKKLTLLLFVSGIAWAGPSQSSSPPIHFESTDGSVAGYPRRIKVSSGSIVDNGDGSFTISTSSNGSTPGGGFANVQYNANGALGGRTNFNVYASSTIISSSGNDVQPMLAISNTDTTHNPGGMVITSTGTGTPLKITPQGLTSGGYQNRLGALTIGDAVPTRPYSTLLVLVDSTTATQNGGALMELWSSNPSHNDPKFWFHVAGHDSSPEIRDDADAPNWEMINTSTDNAHGMGKWEPAAISYQGVDLQVNSRSWDNSTFENLAKWHPLGANDGRPSGLYLAPQDLTNDSGVLSSSNTSVVRFGTRNGHEIGITGPLDVPSGSWDLRLPSESTVQGAMLYGGANDSFNARTMHWTTVGTQNQVMLSNGTSAPAFTNYPTSKTKAQLISQTPDYEGEPFYCSDCTTDGIVVSTATTPGGVARISARTTPIN